MTRPTTTSRPGRGPKPHGGLRPGAHIRLQVTDLDEAGLGVGRVGEVDVAVPDVLPGEQAEIVVEHLSPHRARAWGRVLQRVGPPAPERVPPSCPAFGRCGGCVWQHLAYGAQLERKRGLVAGALAAAGLGHVPVAPVLAAPAVTGYRNKGKYVIGTGPDGLVLGAYAPRTHEVVDTAGCRVVEPVIDRVAGAVREALTRTGLPAYDERRRTGVLRYAILRTGASGEVLVGLVTAGRAHHERLQGAARELEGHSEVAGVVWLENQAESGALLDPQGAVACLAGRPTVTELVSGPGPRGRNAGQSTTQVAIALGIGDFFQVNRAQAARLYAEAAQHVAALAPTDSGPDGMHVIDLYTGVGGIAFAVARSGARVLGVEAFAGAVAAARAAAERAGVSGQVRFCAGDAADLGRLAEEMRPDPPDVIVVNPPRKGLEANARAAVIAAAPAGIVYVSCGPASLARDLAALVQAGWRIERVQPVDLMPGTPQIETAVSLRRDQARAGAPARDPR
jgi:23S rRNA (uracil1939-C5)-methyltransferase